MTQFSRLACLIATQPIPFCAIVEASRALTRSADAFQDGLLEAHR